ncbi:MAG: S41 family peptidase [Acidobacteria bacterium]|nr:MAG: S41 family peptidase [Acidobacteriota bacterium]
MRSLRSLPRLLPAVAAALLVGGIVASAGGATGRQMATYAEILSLIETRHVPEADPKKVIYASIHGMLNTLDPHSNFLDDEAYREMREEQRGSFFGLGIVISKRGRYQPLRVISPIANTPAARLGVRAGDVITHIRDERAGVDVDTLGLTVQEAVKYLRGPRGTDVTITVDRPGIDEPLRFTITRDAVRTPAVNQAFMIRPGVAYVHIANFTETTSSELDRALARLRDEGATRLVLDLSNNPGGLLEQAVGTASRFLEPDELVVYTEGRLPGSRQDYLAMRDVPRVDWPMVVVVDAGSASASEIVAGALQDHDRAILVGQRTFGKGLVQSVYPLSEGTALALTTQKYYSPLGRTIQRPYASEEEYFFEPRRADREQRPEPGAPEFRTPTGRVIYGGGGILPDIVTEPPSEPEAVLKLMRLSAFSRFVNPLPDDTREAYAADPDRLLTDFRDFVAAEYPDIAQDELEAHRDELLLQLRAELTLVSSGIEARDRVLLQHNPVIQRAIAALDQAEQLLAARRRAREQRRAAVDGQDNSR